MLSSAKDISEFVSYNKNMINITVEVSLDLKIPNSFEFAKVNYPLANSKAIEPAILATLFIMSHSSSRQKILSSNTFISKV